jgi:acetyl-CoA acetyltransferase
MRIPMISANPRKGVPHTSEVVNAVDRAMERAGIGHKDIDVLEIADNSVWQVLAWPELLGFAEPGQGDSMLLRGELAIGGSLPINPSGGFLSSGEATTAQALLQVCELAWQLRGEAEGHQVESPRVAMSAVLGLGANGGSVILQR